MNRKHVSMCTLLLLASTAMSVSTWCRMPFVLSRKHINQVKQQLKYEESRLAKLKAIAYGMAAGGIGGIGYYSYKWLKESPVPQAQSGQNQPQRQTGVKAWLLDQVIDISQIAGRTVKGVIAYELYSALRDRINDIYAERTFPWFLQRRTVWHTALDNFKQEVVNYNPQDQESKEQLETACRCLLAELESIIAFMQHTTERAQEQLKYQPHVVHVSKVYLTRLRMSSEKIKAIAARFIEHVTLLLDYNQDYEQKRSMHNTLMGSLIDDLNKEVTLFKQFEQELKFSVQVLQRKS